MTLMCPLAIYLDSGDSYAVEIQSALFVSGSSDASTFHGDSYSNRGSVSDCVMLDTCKLIEQEVGCML